MSRSIKTRLLPFRTNPAISSALIFSPDFNRIIIIIEDIIRMFAAD